MHLPRCCERAAVATGARLYQLRSLRSAEDEAPNTTMGRGAPGANPFAPASRGASGRLNKSSPPGAPEESQQQQQQQSSSSNSSSSSSRPAAGGGLMRRRSGGGGLSRQSSSNSTAASVPRTVRGGSTSTEASRTEKGGGPGAPPLPGGFCFPETNDPVEHVALTYPGGPAAFAADVEAAVTFPKALWAAMALLLFLFAAAATAAVMILQDPPLLLRQETGHQHLQQLLQQQLQQQQPQQQQQQQQQQEEIQQEMPSQEGPLREDSPSPSVSAYRTAAPTPSTQSAPEGGLERVTAAEAVGEEEEETAASPAAGDEATGIQQRELAAAAAAAAEPDAVAAAAWDVDPTKDGNDAEEATWAPHGAPLPGVPLQKQRTPEGSWRPPSPTALSGLVLGVVQKGAPLEPPKGGPLQLWSQRRPRCSKETPLGGIAADTPKGAPLLRLPRALLLSTADAPPSIREKCLLQPSSNNKAQQQQPQQLIACTPEELLAVLLLQELLLLRQLQRENPAAAAAAATGCLLHTTRKNAPYFGPFLWRALSLVLPQQGEQHLLLQQQLLQLARGPLAAELEGVTKGDIKRAVSLVHARSVWDGEGHVAVSALDELQEYHWSVSAAPPAAAAAVDQLL